MRDRGLRCVVDFPVDSKGNRISRTKQNFAKDADINNIMSRYRRTGLLVDPVSCSYRRPNFGDFSDMVELPFLIDRIRSAQSSFMVLPAALRERFHNEVAELIDFVSDPKNVKEAVDLHLLPASVLPQENSPIGKVEAGLQSGPPASAGS